MVAEGHSLKKRESYLVSRISKKDFGALKRIGLTRYEIRTTRYQNGDGRNYPEVFLDNKFKEW